MYGRLRPGTSKVVKLPWCLFLCLYAVKILWHKPFYFRSNKFTEGGNGVCLHLFPSLHVPFRLRACLLFMTLFSGQAAAVEADKSELLT